MKRDHELHRPFAWAIAILLVLAIGIVAAAPRRMSSDERHGPDRDVPPPACPGRNCEHLIPHEGYGIELYVQRTGGLI